MIITVALARCWFSRSVRLQLVLLVDTDLFPSDLFTRLTPLWVSAVAAQSVSVSSLHKLSTHFGLASFHCPSNPPQGL